MASMQQQIGNRRVDAWWEPTHNASLANPLPESDWLFVNSTGAQGSFLPADTLCALGAAGVVLKHKGLTFTQCNFQGEFEHRPSMMFDKCRFHECDFAFSSWSFVTFRECEFIKCSISLSVFKDCEFRDCVWQEIGFTGSKTNIDRTFVTNPGDLIGAGFSGVDPGRAGQASHASYQKYRLEGTKSHIARTLLYSHQRVGDDATFYATAKAHDIQQNKAKLYRYIYASLYEKQKYKRLLALLIPAVVIERILLQAMGSLNGWGANLLRPLVGLVSSALVFAVIYRFVPLGENIATPWQKAFDIANIAGYGSQVNNSQSIVLRRVEGIQLIVSILFYTVFFSTAVARNSRAR